MDQPLTIVLPVHNRERQLRSSVLDILDLVQSMRRPVDVVIVDDGSTDETYETAFELARQFPQLIVLRQSIRQGIGAALELVRNRMAVEMVLVHDGVSTIDASDLQQVLQTTRPVEGEMQRAGSATESAGSRRFSAVRALHDRMEKVHRAAVSFRWIQLDQPLVPRRRPRTASPTATAMNTLSAGLPVSMPQMPTGMLPTSQS